MKLETMARHGAAQAVCLGSATLAAAYYSAWAPNDTIFYVLCVVAFALDLVKPQCFIAAEHAAKNEQTGKAWAARCLGILLALVSMVAVDGMMLKLRSDTADDKTGTQTSYDRAKAEFDKIEAQLKPLAEIEPKGALEAKLQGSVPVEVWRRTKECTEVSQGNSRKACEPAFAIRAEIAKAERRDQLEIDLKGARAKLDGTKRPSSADPQVDAMAKVSGLEVSTIMLMLTWLAGLALELVACLAPWLLTRESDEPAPESALTPQQQALHWVMGEFAKSGGKLEILNGALAAKFSVDPGTVTRWRQQWIEQGLIVEERRGRTIRMSLAR